MMTLLNYVFDDGTSTPIYEEALTSGKNFKVCYNELKEKYELTENDKKRLALIEAQLS